MTRMHSVSPTNSNKTRCGLSLKDVWTTHDNGRVTCQRCEINIRWEKEKEDAK